MRVTPIGEVIFAGPSSSVCLASLLAEEKRTSVSANVVAKKVGCEEIW